MARVARFGYLTIVWFWLGGVLLTSRRHLRLAVGMWTISIAIDGLAAVAQARGLSLPLAGQVMGGRMSGYTEQINDLGGAAAVAVAPALALVATASRLSRQFLWVLVLLGIVAALVLSGSVGGMAAGIGAVGVWFVVASKGVRPVLVAAAAIALAIGIAHVQGSLGLPTPAERVLAVTGVSEGEVLDDRDASSRLRSGMDGTWRRGLAGHWTRSWKRGCGWWLRGAQRVSPGVVRGRMGGRCRHGVCPFRRLGSCPSRHATGGWPELAAPCRRHL